MKTHCVATFNALSPALVLSAQLKEAGINAFINDESVLERFWFMSEPLAAIHVEVKQPDYLTALKLIREWETSRGVLKDAVRCPDCGSSRVEFPQITRKFLSPVVQVLFMALHLMPREFYCMDCQFTWPKEKPVEPDNDIIGWPKRPHFWHPNFWHTEPAQPPLKKSV